MFAKNNADGNDPSLAAWQELLETGELAGPREPRPTRPDRATGEIRYGRVAGVARGSQWQGKIVDGDRKSYLTIPEPGKALSYGISTLLAGTLGTKQIQSAPMLARYQDTAYQAHGNYGVQYSLSLPVYNPRKEEQPVTIAFHFPIKEDQLTKGGLRFSAGRGVAFRGTIRL